MSPNGRRAWRKWCKSRRRKMNAHHRALYTGANMRKAQPVELGMPIPKPFTPRSLVGMTMGARKRRWAKDYDALPQSGRAAKTVSMLRAYGVYPKEGNPLAQRLRPCPGCPECDHGKGWRCHNCGTTKGLCDLILSEVRCKCGKGCGQWRISYPATTICDGSGVLPAKHQLCLGCSWCGTPPKDGAARFTECDGSGVLPARRSK